ncbi:DUF692 domain-containing protein [Bradyrhizobium sp.]|uniref:DUF692 domain-containing protein n=1 Tax=Bradyrhizobium sp. TaxID=376 RepID=UPI00238A6211|nr:DUF692 domain-containing protein [Bradyrhizobium sp.]MDE1935981.1 DUF692 domain-containing protein [Bradyrhizobium sp.]
MSISQSSQDHFPARGGVGLKAEHCCAVVEALPDVGFFEVDVGSYLRGDGPPHRCLAAIRERYKLSLHGMGLAIGGDRPLDANRLQRLTDFIRQYRPGLISEHLAWSSPAAESCNKSLPVRYTAKALVRVAEHIDQVQDAIGQQLLLENPSSDGVLADGIHAEIEFVAEVVRRTGCGLLLDVKKVCASSINQQWDPFVYINTYPMAHVWKVHLAGPARGGDKNKWPLVVGSYNCAIDQIVWDLFTQVIRRIGPIPTLIEGDTDMRAWPILLHQAERAEAIMVAVSMASFFLGV